MPTTVAAKVTGPALSLSRVSRIKGDSGDETIMLEILRRLLFLGGLLTATAMALQAAPLLLRVQAEDMAAAYQRARAGKDGFFRKQAAGESLGAFIAERTKGRLIEVSGPAWEAFFADLARATAGDNATWAARRGEGYAGSSFFFRPDESPLDTVMAQAKGGFTFLRMATAETVRHAGITQVRANDAAATAPTAFAFPWRSAAPWAALAGLVAYGLIPWPRRGDDRTLTYRRARAAIVPDFVGAILASLFFGLPFLIVGGNTPSGSVFEDGWLILTVVLWLMALGGASILGFSARYAAFRLTIGEDGLRQATLFGERSLPFTQIARVEFADYRAPKWLRTLMFIGGAFNFRLMGQALLMEARRDWGIALVLRDGQRARVMMSYLDGADRLVDALEKAGIPVAAAIRNQPARTRQRCHKGETN